MARYLTCERGTDEYTNERQDKMQNDKYKDKRKSGKVKLRGGRQQTVEEKQEEFSTYYVKKQKSGLSKKKNLNFLPEEPLLFTRSLRNGRDFDTLLGRSFGTSKRDFRRKRNFDEIDNAGFKDYLYKRNFDEIDNAGFRNNLERRNFDEIDNAGFQDYLYKRNFDEIDNAGFTDYLSKRNLYEIDNVGFRNSLHKKPPSEIYYALLKEFSKSCKTDKCKKKIENLLSRFVIHKRNFDEIDNAGFRDYLYKKSVPALQNPMFAATA